MTTTQVWPRQVALQFDSALLPLLDDLYQDVAHHEEVTSKVKQLQTRYALPNAVWPDSEETRERVAATAEAFDDVLKHVLAVEAHSDSNFVLLPRERLADGNCLHTLGCRSKPEQTVRTRSQIMANSTGLGLTYLPHLSNEVMVHSPILANSSEVRAIAMLT